MKKLNTFGIGVKYYFIIAVLLFLLPANKSNASISFDKNGFDKLIANTTAIPQFDFRKVFIFSGLSLPAGIDFTKNAEQIHQNVSNLPLEKYKTDITQLVSGFGQNVLVKDIYSFFITILKLIGGVLIRILEFMLVIIRRGLSFIS